MRSGLPVDQVGEGPLRREGLECRIQGQDWVLQAVGKRADMEKQTLLQGAASVIRASWEPRELSWLPQPSHTRPRRGQGLDSGPS